MHCHKILVSALFVDMSSLLTSFISKKYCYFHLFPSVLVNDNLFQFFYTMSDLLVGGEGVVFQIFNTKKTSLKIIEKTSKHRIIQQEVCTFIIWLSQELGTPYVYTFQQLKHSY